MTNMLWMILSIYTYLTTKNYAVQGHYLGWVKKAIKWWKTKKKQLLYYNIYLNPSNDWIKKKRYTLISYNLSYMRILYKEYNICSNMWHIQENNSIDHIIIRCPKYAKANGQFSIIPNISPTSSQWRKHRIYTFSHTIHSSKNWIKTVNISILFFLTWFYHCVLTVG